MSQMPSLVILESISHRETQKKTNTSLNKNCVDGGFLLLIYITVGFIKREYVSSSKLVKLQKFERKFSREKKSTCFFLTKILPEDGFRA